MKRQFLITALAVAIPGMALAAKMPAGAVPLTTDEVKALYADHTAAWKSSSAYFATDGTVKGIFGDHYVFWGQQSVSGNEMCMTNQSLDGKTKTPNPKKATDCWKWVKAADGKFWTLYSKAWDGKKLDLMNAWYSEEATKLKQGNLIGDKYKALGGS